MQVGSSTALRREATNETTTFKSSDKNSDRYLFLGGEIGLIRRSELPAISVWKSSFFLRRFRLVVIGEVPPIVGIIGSDGEIASWWSGCMFIGPAEFCRLVRIII